MTEKNIIGFDLLEGEDTIQSVNPADGSTLPGNFHVATGADLELALSKAEKAFVEYRAICDARRADFLEEIANQIEAIGDELIERASLETGLPNGRFQGERGRTVGQLRLFATLLRKGEWVNASITPAMPNREPLPRADIRKMERPIGPVAVFTASNFPLAFSTAGGDSASALAAGCPIIVKAHEAHLGVNNLVAQAISKAAQITDMPDGVFSSLVARDYKLGQELVKDARIKAVAFTGSYRGGKALYDLAQTRPTPIPVYAEMGSVNPVVLLENKLSSDANLAQTVAGSITLGVGQFCTNPGLLLAVKSSALESFKNELSSALNGIPCGTMLTAGIQNAFVSGKSKLASANGIDVNTNGEDKSSTLASVSAADFIANPLLQEEIFGPISLLVECDSQEELIACINKLEGQLTGTIMHADGDEGELPELIATLEPKVGRLIFNNPPTGVEVCESMVHGGPFPAATDSRSTSVGTTAIYRFTRPVAFQNMPDQLLPEALRNNNPLQIIRLVNGVYTKDNLTK